MLTLTIDFIDDTSESSLRRAELLGGLLREAKRLELVSDGRFKCEQRVFPSVALWNRKLEEQDVGDIWAVFMHAPNTPDWQQVAIELSAESTKRVTLCTYSGGGQQHLVAGPARSQECRWWQHFPEVFGIGDLLARSVAPSEAPYLVSSAKVPFRKILQGLLIEDGSGETEIRDRMSDVVCSSEIPNSYLHTLSNVLVPVILLLSNFHLEFVERGESGPCGYDRIQQALSACASRISELNELPPWIYRRIKRLVTLISRAIDDDARDAACQESDVVLRGILATVLGQSRTNRPIEELRGITRALCAGSMPKLLWIEDEPTWYEALHPKLEEAGFEITFSSEPKSLEGLLSKAGSFDVFLIDLALPGFGPEVSRLLKSAPSALEAAEGEDEGIALVSLLRQIVPADKAIVVLSADDSPRSVHLATKAGADSYYGKARADYLELATLLANSVASRSSRLQLSPAPLNPSLVVADSDDPLSGVVEYLHQITAREQDGPIVLVGEPGTGKELLAKEAHLSSKRAGGPFVVFDCPSYPAELVEGHLFGYRRGAFTGASENFVGAFDEANGGTLFLDEIDKLQPQTQNKLLGVLSRRTFRRLGGRNTRELSCLIVVASNSDPQTDEDRFMPAMARRLARFPVNVPNLRERGRASSDLADAIARRIAQGEYELPPFGLDPTGRLWVEQKVIEGVFDGRAGNVAGLESILYRVLAVRSASGGDITRLELERAAQGVSERTGAPEALFSLLGRKLGSFIFDEPGMRLRECEHLTRVALYRYLIVDKGLSKAKVAELLSVTPSNLSNDLRRLRNVGALREDL